MKTPDTMSYRIPTYPARWRRWLWYATRGRLAFPVWAEYEFDGIELHPTKCDNPDEISYAVSFKSVRRVV